MVEFTHILCPVDLSEFSTRSLAHAAALSRWYNAQLTVLHVVPSFDPVEVRGDLGMPVHIVNPAPRERVLEEMRRVVDRAAGSARTSVVAESGDPRTVIVDQALTAKADLIVMGTHGHRGFQRLMLGSVTESLLRTAPCPVLTVPPNERTAASQVTFTRVLCAVDFSPSSLQAVGFAVDLARQAEGRVTLVSALEWLAEEEPRSLAHFNVPEFRGLLARNTEDQLRALAAGESSQTSSAIETLVVFGRAHRQILRVAEEQSVDLIVMGAQGRGGLSLALFGSTTQQVVRSAACPVLIVRGVQER